MFVSLSCSLSLPSKKGYLGSRAIFLLPLSLPPRRLRRGALTSGEGCCSLYSLPAGEGERRCFSSSSVMFLTARGGAVARGRSRVWSGLPGTAIPAPVPPGVAALGGGGICRVPRGRRASAGRAEGEGAPSSPHTLSTLICLLSRVYVQDSAENSCAGRASPANPAARVWRGSPGSGSSPQVLSFSKSSPRAPAGTKTKAPARQPLCAFKNPQKAAHEVTVSVWP